MRLDRRTGLRLVRIHQPERRLTGVLRSDSLNGRGVAIGDRTIDSYEDQHDRLPGISVQRIHRFACEIDSAWRRWLTCTNGYGADPADDRNCCRETKDQQKDCRNALPIAVHWPPHVARSDSKQDASQSTSAHA